MKNYKDLLPGEVLDLSNEIAVLSPVDTPLLTLLMTKGKLVPATDITVSWREKELNSDRAIKAEGSEAGTAVKSVRKLKSNICQIMEKVVAVSGTVNALNPHGIGNEFANEVADRLTEYKRDLEYYCLNGVKSTEDNRQMAGLTSLVDESHVINHSAELTEDVIIDALQKMWEAGAHGEVYGFVNASVKRAVNKLLKDHTTQIVEQGENTFGIVVTKYETDFGTINLVLDRHMKNDEFLIVDLDKVELAELRKPAYADLARTGDYKKGHIVGESTIKLLNSKAGVVIKGITSPMVMASKAKTK